MTANEFSREEVVAMEKEVARAIDYNFDTFTISELLTELYSSQADLIQFDKKVHFLSMYLSDLSLLSSRLSCRYKVKVIAMACLTLASIELSSTQPLVLPISSISNVEMDLILECVQELHELQYQLFWSRLRNNKLDSVNRKWKQKLKLQSESGHFTQEESTAIGNV